jgi:hypothetical protein
LLLLRFSPQLEETERLAEKLIPLAKGAAA